MTPRPMGSSAKHSAMTQGSARRCSGLHCRRRGWRAAWAGTSAVGPAGPPMTARSGVLACTATARSAVWGVQAVGAGAVQSSAAGKLGSRLARVRAAVATSGPPRHVCPLHSECCRRACCGGTRRCAGVEQGWLPASLLQKVLIAEVPRRPLSKSCSSIPKVKLKVNTLMYALLRVGCQC